MALDAMIIAHGEVFRLLASLLGGVALIVVAVVNGLIAVSVGSLLGCATFRTRRTRVRVAIGVIVALMTFVALWMVELVTLIHFIEVPKA